MLVKSVYVIHGSKTATYIRRNFEFHLLLDFGVILNITSYPAVVL